MPVKDLHSEPFDNSTIAKLEIFEDYWSNPLLIGQNDGD